MINGQRGPSHGSIQFDDKELSSGMRSPRDIWRRASVAPFQDRGDVIR